MEDQAFGFASRSGQIKDGLRARGTDVSNDLADLSLGAPVIVLDADVVLAGLDQSSRIFIFADNDIY